MGILDFFKKKTEIMPLDDEENEIKTYRRQKSKQEQEFLREKIKLDLDTAKLENEMKRQEMQANIEERRLDMEIRRIQKESQLMDLQQRMYGDEEEEEADPADDMFSGLIAAVLKKTQNPNPPAPVSTPAQVVLSPQQGTVLTDEEIKGRWSQVPEEQKAAAKMLPDEKLKELLIQREPNMSAQTISRAIEILRAA